MVSSPHSRLCSCYVMLIWTAFVAVGAHGTIFTYVNGTHERANEYESLPALFGVPFLDGRLYEGVLQYLVENPFLCDEIQWNHTSFVDLPPPLSAVPPRNKEDEDSSEEATTFPSEPSGMIEPVVMLASRGQCPFHAKALVAESLGARVEYLIVHNHNWDGEDVVVPMYSEFGTSRLRILSVSHRTGTALKRYIYDHMVEQQQKQSGNSGGKHNNKIKYEGPIVRMDSIPPEGLVTSEELQEVLLSTLGVFLVMILCSGGFLMCAAAAVARNRRRLLRRRGNNNTTNHHPTSPLWMILMGDPDQDPVMVGDPAAVVANLGGGGGRGSDLLSADEVEYFLVQRQQQHIRQQPQQEEEQNISQDASSETFRAGHPLHGVNELQCAICIDDFDDSVTGDQVLKLPCNHVFHTQCIVPWLTERQSKCPLCKFDVYAYVLELAGDDGLGPEGDQRSDDQEDNPPESGVASPRVSFWRPPRRRRPRRAVGASWLGSTFSILSAAASWTEVQQDQQDDDDNDGSGHRGGGDEARRNDGENNVNNPEAEMEFELEMAVTNGSTLPAAPLVVPSID